MAIVAATHQNARVRSVATFRPAADAAAYRAILGTLYERYYQQAAPSLVTSSHWRSIGWHQVDRDAKGLYHFRGHGFGDGQSRSLWYCAKSIPSLYLTRRLLAAQHAPAALISAAKKIARRSDRIFGFDCAKHVLAFATIRAHLPIRPQTICVIGDGYGYGGALLQVVWPDARLISVNLGRTLCFDVAYSARCRLPAPHLIEDGGLDDRARTIFVEAEALHRLEGIPIDLFVNIASMQEMDPPVIAAYFRLMAGAYFYCCNREEKTLPDGTVVRFVEYPWDDCSVILDERCSWYQRTPTSRPPFWQTLAGPVRHRLVHFRR